MLCVGTALFGMFFFLTIFVQAVWGYSALRSGVAYLPMMAAIMAMSAASAQLVPRIGARPLLIAGSATATGGMSWLSRISEHGHYSTGLLGPTIVAGAGLGMLFTPLALIALSRVRDSDAGAASSLLNTGSRSAARSGWPCSALSPGPPSPTASATRPPPRPGPATACPRRPAHGCRPRSTGTRSRPGSPAGSRCRRGSRSWP